jgi:membrane dipeptidase
MLDHVDRVARLTGVEHVGIGSDVDLVGHAPNSNADLQGIEYQKKFFAITEGLVRRKYNADQIRMIIGANFQRALSQIWSA